MNRIALIFLSLIFSLTGKGQALEGMLRGRVTDRGGVPLASASVHLRGPQEMTALADEQGNFEIQAPVGRYELIATYTGFAASHIEVLVIAGRPTFITIMLTPTEIVLDEVSVQASNMGDNVSGLRSLTIEKALRLPANFFDPVRVATSYPGVVAVNDQANSIIVRGNSPNGLLWRLNGLDIVNPNHLANAGTFSDRPAANGGGVNILSAQMLSKTDFFTGNIPAKFGNTLAGVIDMNLREGNKSDFNYTAQASLIGLDVAAEGPINKGNSSFLANYRYSTIGLLSAMGVNFGDEAINFQDFSFNTSTRVGHGDLTVFGLWGKSKNEFDAKKEAEWEEEKDQYDIAYDADTYAVGLKYVAATTKGKLSIGAAYSASEQSRDQGLSKQYFGFIGVVDDHYRSSSGLFSSSINYDLNVGRTSTVSVGTMANVINNELQSSVSTLCLICPEPLSESRKASNDGVLLQPYVSMTASISPKLEINAGTRFLYFTFHDSKSIEPRVALTYNTSTSSAVNISYTLVSQLQQPQIFLSEGNEDLGFTRSHHLDLGLVKNWEHGLSFHGNLFYQYLFDVPVETTSGSTYSALNQLESWPPPNLINEGTGANYGFDATVEKMFYGNHYFIIGGSYYQSKYKTFDNREFDSRFNGSFTANSTYGKEWINKSKNRTIALSTRMLYIGGLREMPVNEPTSFDSGVTVYNTSKGFSEKLNDYVRFDLRVSLRKDKPGYTRTLALDIQNLFNIENDAYHYYDTFTRSITLKKQLGMIPIIVYRIDF